MVTITIHDKRPNRDPKDYDLTVADGTTVGDVLSDIQDGTDVSPTENGKAIASTDPVRPGMELTINPV